MAEVKFRYECQDIIIQCNKNQKMKDICINLSNKINVNINSLIFLYGDFKLNLEKKYKEITKENRIDIIVYKYENEEIIPKCGKIVNNEILDEIIISNNIINSSLIGIKRQIELLINNKVDISFIKSQLKNINVIINNINEDIKKMNNRLNSIKLNDNNNIKLNDNNYNKEGILKNEILCIYNKQEDEINLLYDYSDDMLLFEDEEKKLYIEGKNNINDKNIDIYINDKKIKFNYKYKSNERGNIQVKFVFNKLLTCTTYMFSGCSSLQSINLSSFNTINVNNMSYMFYGCSSLQSIDLSSFNTTNVNNLSYMFSGCSSLQSIDLSSFNTTKVKNMVCMFDGCSSLQSIDLSSFNTTNVEYMSSMFNKCSSLKKKKVKINNYGKKILDKICWK